MRVTFYGRLAADRLHAAIAAHHDVSLRVAPTVSSLINAIAQSDALIMADVGGQAGAEIAAALRRRDCPVRWVQFLSAGCDGVLRHDVGAVLVATNQGGANAPVAAEHAMALLLAITRQLPELTDRQRRHEWRRDVATPLGSLDGATFAVLGMGHIGLALAHRARAFGMTVVGMSRTGAPSPSADETFRLADLTALLPGMDVVALALPVAPDTRGVIGARELAAVKPGAVLINVARGELVDTDALIAALRGGRLGGAGLDVTDPAPLPPDSPLWTMPNVIITPHVAGRGSAQVESRVVDVVMANLARFMSGAPLEHVVHLISP